MPTGLFLKEELKEVFNEAFTGELKEELKATFKERIKSWIHLFIFPYSRSWFAPYTNMPCPYS
jgi:hypothetical protein